MSHTSTPHLLYLHGFNSSPASHKARLLQQRMERYGLLSRLSIPAIAPQPDIAANQLTELADSLVAEHRLCIAGSSLGGFYATWLAERYACKAVLINPAVGPHRLLQKYLGENQFYHSDETWRFKQKHLDVLQAMYVDTISESERYLVLLQTGDETLDYRQAESYYTGCHMLIEQDGDHSFTDFESHIDRLLEFCGFTLQER